MIRYNASSDISHWLKLVVLALSCLLASGCVNTSVIRRLDTASVPGPPFGRSTGSQAQIAGESARLVDDITRSFRDLHWGRMYVKPWPDDDDRDEPDVVQAAGLLDDGRRAIVAAWPQSDKHIGVAVCVGHFGDGDEERRFIRMLEKTLAGEAKPKRGGGFELPQ